MNHPLVGICWDTGHAQVSGHDQRAAIESLGSRLKALHIQENDGGSDDHLLPFATVRNGVKWHDVAQALGAIGYGGAFVFETRNAFDAVPDELFDDHLQLAVKIARYITGHTAGQ